MPGLSVLSRLRRPGAQRPEQISAAKCAQKQQWAGIESLFDGTSVKMKCQQGCHNMSECAQRQCFVVSVSYFSVCVWHVGTAHCCI